MHAPQIILICLMTFNVAVAMAMHGKPKGKYNVLTSLIDVPILVGLLYWGGFFSQA